MQKDLNKEELENYYSTHTFKDTAEHFKIGKDSLNKIFHKLGIEKRKRNYTEQGLANLKSKERSNKISKSFQDKTPEEKESRIQKIKDTSIRLYGVDSYSKTDECKEVTRKVNLQKYGVEYHTQTTQWREFKSNFYANRSEEEIQESNNKRAITMQEKYGVDWYCMHPGSRNKNKRNSKPNLKFKTLLEQNGFEVDEVKNREFPINNYQYDFKINNILIEINPSTTHNSTFGIYGGNPLDKFYHYNKTKYALDNGFRCLNVFDWTDKEIIIKLLKEENFLQVEGQIQKHLFNMKTKEHILSNDLDINSLEDSNHWVEIYDEGFKIITEQGSETIENTLKKWK